MTANLFNIPPGTNYPALDCNHWFQIIALHCTKRKDCLRNFNNLQKKFGKIGKNAQLKNWRQKINFLTIHITNTIKMLLFR